MASVLQAADATTDQGMKLQGTPAAKARLSNLRSQGDAVGVSRADAASEGLGAVVTEPVLQVGLSDLNSSLESFEPSLAMLQQALSLSLIHI